MCKRALAMWVAWMWCSSSPPCARVALVRAALSQGMLSLASSVDTYDMLHAFAFSSAASSVRKPPESERCTTCRQVVDMLRMHTCTRGRHRAESGHPLSDSPTCGEVYVWRDGCRLCVAWVELRSALRGALRSRSAPTCSSNGGSAVRRHRREAAASGGREGEGAKNVHGREHSLEVCRDVGRSAASNPPGCDGG